jgi:hypothetical protein
MGLIQLVVTLCAIGVILWLINTYIPMEAMMKNIVNAVVIIAVVVWLMLLFVGPLPHINIGR